MAQIKIDPRYWDGVKNDYSDWRFAWVREAGQNSLDAGATRIDITLNDLGDRVQVTWRDNGCGMDQSVLINKFLAMGASGKEFGGTTGGFGKAKELLLLTHIEYQVSTMNFRVQGRHAEYEFTDSHPHIDGTELVVTMDERRYLLQSAIEKWVNNTTTQCVFYLDGELLETAGPLSGLRRDLSWSKLYECGDNTNQISVRMNGQLMFTRYTSVRASLVLELIGNSSDYMTSNRDSLQWTYSDKLDKLVELIFADPEQILEREEQDVQVWSGNCGRLKFYIDPDELPPDDKPLQDEPDQTTAPTFDMDEAAEAGKISAQFIAEAGENVVANAIRVIDRTNMGIAVEDPDKVDAALPFMPKVVRGHDIIVVNRLNRDIPEQFIPGSMSPYAKRLLKQWNELLVAVGAILERRDVVSSGWIFKLNAIASSTTIKDIGPAILLNPTKIVDGKMQPAFDFGWSSFNILLIAAVHEITHIDWNYHSDGWATTFSHNMARVNCYRKAVNKLWRTR